MQTAGKTVAFSAVTVAISLSALLVFPLAFLRSFAYAGIGVSLLAGAVSIVFLPALLAVLGPRVNSLRLWRREPKPVGEGVWHRIAMFVMRRPVPIAIVVVVLLLALGIPFLRIQFGLPDDRVLPPDLSSRQVQDDIRTRFSSDEGGALQVVADRDRRPDTRTADVDRYAAELSRPRRARRASTPSPAATSTGSTLPARGHWVARFQADDATWLSVVPSVEPYSDAGERLANAVRDDRAPFPVLVTGPSAELVDSKESIFARLPIALGLVALATFVLLFLMFGSVLVPIKALILNVLSLSAMFGALVWIFQDGNFSGVLDFTATGTTAGVDTAAAVLHRVRPVDGLRGVPALAHQGGARPHRRQHQLGRHRPRTHRPHRDRGRRPDQRGVPRLRDLAVSRSSRSSASASRSRCSWTRS